MSHIEQKTISTLVYIDSRGKETPLRDLDPGHLVNAYTNAVKDGENNAQSDEKFRQHLKDEIVRRLYHAEGDKVEQL